MARAAGGMARPDHAEAAPLASRAVSEKLEFTGERFLPGASGEIWCEHWHRYHFAAKLVSGMRVLDVACGEGYGSALLARHASRVVGADISPDAIGHARARYADVPNVEFAAADCAALPFADASFDAVVSFETIEHIRAQEDFLDEVRRVLRPGGLFVLSSPNKLEYSDRRGFANAFHIRELYREELAALLKPRFPHARWFGQRMSFFSIVWPEDTAVEGEVFEVSESSATECSPGHSRPIYFVVAASDDAEMITSVAPRLSVLADREEWVYADYMKAVEHEKIQWERGNTLDRVVAEWQGHFREATRQLQTTVAAQAAERARLAQQIDSQQHEIERRASVRWWLALPWRRLRDALRRVIAAGVRQ
jgi:SAM-dependent methyltransferase